MNRKWVVAAALLVMLAPSSRAEAQIGNLDWVQGKERKPADKENAPMQFIFELSAGMREMREQYRGVVVWSDKELIEGIDIGARYRLFQLLLSESAKLDIALRGTVGVIVPEIEFDLIGVAGSVAPEMGLQLFANSGITLTPFVSFGPGLIWSDEYIFDDVDLIWISRAGLELHPKGKVYSISIGAKYYSREKDHYRSEWSQRNISGFIALGIRI